MPPMIPVRMPLAGDAPEASAMPMQRGNATRKTTRDAETSLIRRAELGGENVMVQFLVFASRLIDHIRVDSAVDQEAIS